MKQSSYFIKFAILVSIVALLLLIFKFFLLGTIVSYISYGLVFLVSSLAIIDNLNNKHKLFKILGFIFLNMLISFGIYYIKINNVTLASAFFEYLTSSWGGGILEVKIYQIVRTNILGIFHSLVYLTTFWSLIKAK